MSLVWLRNVAGFSVKEDELKAIPYPVLELNLHVTLKCVQALGTLGTLVFGPLVGIAKRDSRNFNGLVKSSTRFGKYGVIIGLFLGPAMTYGRMKSVNADQSAFYDRCYRLRNNKNQVRVDKAFFAGLLVGGVGFPLIFKMCPIFGGLFGMSAGVVSAGLYNNK